MTRPLLLVIAATLAVGQLAAAQERQTPLRIAASSFATTAVHLNSRRIGNQWY
jgi:hypothetical protein